MQTDLMLLEQREEFKNIADGVYDIILKKHPELNERLNLYQKRATYRDINYILDCLMVAIELKEPILFEQYSRWLLVILVRVMDYFPKEEVLQQNISTFLAIDTILKRKVSQETYETAHNCIERGCDAMREATLHYEELLRLTTVGHEKKVRQYIEYILQGDARGAIQYIRQLVDDGMSVDEVLVGVIQDCMLRIGDMWYLGKVTVDQEHFCTTVTQKAMAQFYPEIIKQKRIDRKIITACIGSELHEMGARMIADVFELNGWDAIHLGAGVPTVSIVSAVEEYAPELVALSVTMPNHLNICQKAVKVLRERYPDLAIAVGGRAFDALPDLWKQMDAQIYTKDANELYDWARENII